MGEDVNPITIRIAVIGVASVSLLVFGWTMRGWYEDSKDLAATAAIEKSREVMRDLANQVSKETETAIQGIRIENRTIYTQAEKEIVRDVVYRDCVLPEPGRMLVNKARSGAATGKPDGTVQQSGTPP